MIIRVHTYREGGRWVWQEDNENTFIKDLEGTRQIGARIRTLVHVAFDDEDIDGGVAKQEALNAIHDALKILTQLPLKAFMK